MNKIYKRYGYGNDLRYDWQIKDEKNKKELEEISSDEISFDDDDEENAAKLDLNKMLIKDENKNYIN